MLIFTARYLASQRSYGDGYNEIPVWDGHLQPLDGVALCRVGVSHIAAILYLLAVQPQQHLRQWIGVQRAVGGRRPLNGEGRTFTQGVPLRLFMDAKKAVTPKRYRGVHAGRPGRTGDEALGSVPIRGVH